MTATIIESEVTELTQEEEEPDDVLHIVCCYNPELPKDKMMTLCGIPLEKAGREYKEGEVPVEPPCPKCDEFLYLHKLCVGECIFRRSL